MNPHLRRLQPYPFERLSALLRPLTPQPARQRVALSLGEPRHDAPAFVVDALASARLYEREHIVVLPGAYLAREQAGVNPGADRVRIALVAPLAECVAAIRRVAACAASCVEELA